MDRKDDGVEEDYGRKKLSYRIKKGPDGFLEVRICHDNKQTRSFIRFHSGNPEGLLSHLDRLSRSQTRAELYLSEIIHKHRVYFENNKVRFVEI